MVLISAVVAMTSPDELRPFQSSGDVIATNALRPLNNPIFAHFWVPVYNYIYETNAIFEGLQKSPGISAPVKRSIGAEARFFRAFFYFYLVNLYGDVPLLTSTDYKANSLA